MVVAHAAAQRDLRSAACGDDGGVRRRPAAMGHERVCLRPVVERALADQVDEGLTQEENGRGHERQVRDRC